MTTPDEESRLMTRALGPAGEARDAALLELVRYLEPVIRVRANRLLEAKRGAAGLTRDEVQDLMQEVWAYLFARDSRVLRGWHPERGLNLRSFVGMVSTRFCIDMLRGRRLNPHLEVATDVNALEKDAALVDDLEARTVSRSFLEWLVASLREILSQDGERLLELMYLEGDSPEEAQQKTGLSRTKIYNQRRRITTLARRLARELNGQVRPDVGST